MATYREARENLLIAYTENTIDCHPFALLYDVNKYLSGENFVGVMFRRLKYFVVLKFRQTGKNFVTFHRRKHLTNFEISNFSKKKLLQKTNTGTFFSFIHFSLFLQQCPCQCQYLY